ncbi:MAG: hypothetical protein K5697_12145 [Lachnospiraceae bacterium]|nr:hypothetical protein [Lachnospiraceae bacterium]
MRKNVIYAKRMKDNYGMLELFYHGDGNTQMLLMTRFSTAVYKYFQYGKSTDQLRRHKDWVRAPTLSRLIERRLMRHIYDIERGKAHG